MIRQTDESGIVGRRRAEEQRAGILRAVGELRGDSGDEGLRGVGLGRWDTEEGSEAGAGLLTEDRGGAVAGVGLAIEAGAALGGLGGADGDREPFGDDGAESAGAPHGGQYGGEGELESAPEPAGGDQVKEA